MAYVVVYFYLINKISGTSVKTYQNIFVENLNTKKYYKTLKNIKKKIYGAKFYFIRVITHNHQIKCFDIKIANINNKLTKN